MLKPKLSEQQIAELTADKASGMKTKELAEKYGISDALVYYYANRERYLTLQHKNYEAKKKSNKFVPKVATTSKSFKVKVSGVNCIVNLPQTMGVEVEITNEALIFNII